MSEIRELFIQAHDNGELGVRGMLTRFQRLLARREPGVAEHFARMRLSADFYAFRWVTTLLTREFAFPEVIMLWDSLLGDPQRFSFLLHFCCGMVRAQRARLLAADFGGCVKLLQHYPEPDFVALLGCAMRLRAEDNADLASRGGPTAGEGSGLWVAPLAGHFAGSPPPKAASAAAAAAGAGAGAGVGAGAGAAAAAAAAGAGAAAAAIGAAGSAAAGAASLAGAFFLRSAQNFSGQLRAAAAAAAAPPPAAAPQPPAAAAAVAP